VTDIYVGLEMNEKGGNKRKYKRTERKIDTYTDTDRQMGKKEVKIRGRSKK